MAAHQVPDLVDDAVMEVLLRCPPDNPARLLCAALVCKRWRRLVSAAAFRRRYAKRHRTAQPLGFVCNFTVSFPGGGSAHTAHFIPSSTSQPRAIARRMMRALDARHGRVLLHDMDIDLSSVDKMRLIVWDPITGVHREVPRLPFLVHSSCWNVAVLCAAAADSCDHLSCHRGHFKVVVVSFHPNYHYAHSCVYSSERGRGWTARTAPLVLTLERPGCRFDLNPSALVGNALHFVFHTQQGSSEILKYDLATMQMSEEKLPPTGFHCPRTVLRATEDGGLGFTIVGESKLYMWSRVDGHSDGGAEWHQSGVIDLEKLLPTNSLLTSPAAVGFAGAGVIFRATQAGRSFVADLKSNQVRKLGEGTRFYSGFPFSSFSIPGHRVGSSSCR